MTVVQPNSIAGINSISVQSGQSLSIHKSDGTLIREIVSDTGISTFSSISVGSATTTNNAAKSINIGLGASIAQHTDNSLTFGTNGDPRATIAADGKIGINQTSPEGLLHIEAGSSGASYTANAADTLILERNGACLIDIRTTAAVEGGIVFSDNSARGVGRILYDHSDNAITFGTNGSAERLRITSGGLVGINTDTIGTNHNLEIFGNASAYAVLNVKSQSLSHGASIELGAQDDDNYGAITQFASGASEGGRMKFVAGTTETMNLRGGKLLVGTTSDTAPIGWGNNLQVAGTSAVAGISIRRDENGTGGALLVFGKSRGSLNGNTVVQNNDQIGGMYFAGGDGTDVNSIAAQVSVEVDGTPGSNDMPGRILFKTTADGAASPTERLRIDSLGNVLIGNLATASASRTGVLVVETNNYNGIQVVRNSADASTPLLSLSKTRGTSSGAVTAVNNGDICGRIRFQGADGDELSDAAYIDCKIDAAPGNNDMAGRLMFYTSADGSSSPTSRLEINKDGYVYVKTGDLDVEAGSISDSKGNVRRVIENEPGGAAYQMVASDAGKFIHHNNTIKMPDSGTFSVGDMITIYAYGALTLDMTKPGGGEATVYNAADASTGDRTFAARSLGTLLCVAADTYVLSGAGIS